MGLDNVGDVGALEIVVDLVHLEHRVVGHVRLGEQDVHVAGHAAGDRVDRELDVDALVAERIRRSRMACWACATAMP